MRIAIAVLALGMLLVAVPTQAEFQTTTFTDMPGLAIPDAGSQVSSPMSVALPHYISDIRVYIAVTHNVSSDLRIWVQSAWGTQVLLFDIGNGGEPGVNPAGWYPTDFTPAEDMNQWVDEGAEGTWTIICQDLSAGEAGTLTEWRLEISYDDAVAADSATWSSVKALYQ